MGSFIVLQWLTLAFVLSVSMGFAATNKASQKSEVETSWEPYLKLLHREAKASSDLLISPYSHAIHEDLQQVYADELASIQQTWVKLISKHDLAAAQNRPSSKILKDRQNQFFHEQIQKLNEKTLSQLEAAAKSHKELPKDFRKAAELALDKIHQNPVLSLDGIMNYPDARQIGFCFARALLLHYFLLQEGVGPENLAKIFVLGQLRVQKQFWNFHVAILVRDSKSGFLVVDPLHPKALEYKQWMSIKAGYDIKSPLSRARFYITDARKFMPAFAAYSQEHFEIPVLKNYFADLLQSLASSSSQ